jgi:hypothetical protein
MPAAVENPMFILWGESDHEEALGVVAGKCARCGAVAPMTLSRKMRRPHVYFLPTGKGRAVAVVVTCWKCNKRVELSRDEFPDYVTEADAERMSLDELLDETNPELANLLRLGPSNDPGLHDAIRKEPLSSTSNDSEADRLASVRDRLVDAVARGHRRLGKLRRELQRWDDLDDAARERFLHHAETILDALDSTMRFEDFAYLANSKLDPAAHRPIPYLLSLVLGILVGLTALFWAHADGRVKPDDRLGFAFACAFLGVVPSILVTVFVEIRRIRGIRLELLRTKLFPMAQKHRIDLDEFREAALESNPDVGASPECRSLWSFATNYLPLFDEVRAEEPVFDEN